MELDEIERRSLELHNAILERRQSSPDGQPDPVRMLMIQNDLDYVQHALDELAGLDRRAACETASRHPTRETTRPPANPRPERHARHRRDDRRTEYLIGQSIMGIVAALLVFAGIIVFNVIAMPYVPVPVRMALAYVACLAMIPAGLKLAGKPGWRIVGLSVAGLGSGGTFVAIMLTYVIWPWISAVVLYAILAIWCTVLCLIGRRRAGPFEAIAHAGIVMSTAAGIVLAGAIGFPGMAFAAILFCAVAAAASTAAFHDMSGKFPAACVDVTAACLLFRLACPYADDPEYLPAYLLAAAIAVLSAFHAAYAMPSSPGKAVAIQACLSLGTIAIACPVEGAVPSMTAIALSIAGFAMMKRRPDGISVFPAMCALLPITASTPSPLAVLPPAIIAVSANAYGIAVPALSAAAAAAIAAWTSIQDGLPLLAFVSAIPCMAGIAGRILSKFHPAPRVDDALYAAAASSAYAMLYAMVPAGQAIWPAAAVFVLNAIASAYLRKRTDADISIAATAVNGCILAASAGTLLGADGENILHVAIATVLCIASAAFRSKDLIDGNPAAAGYYVMAKAAAVVLVVCSAWDLHGIPVTLLLVIAAMASIAYGFRTDAGSARKAGLGLTFLSIAKLAFADLAPSSAAEIAIGLILCGSLCFTVSLAYGRMTRSFLQDRPDGRTGNGTDVPPEDRDGN